MKVNSKAVPLLEIQPRISFHFHFQVVKCITKAKIKTEGVLELKPESFLRLLSLWYVYVKPCQHLFSGFDMTLTLYNGEINVY